MLEIKNLHVKLEDEDKVILKGLTLTVPKGEGDRLKTQIERIDPLLAPLAQGQQVGQIKVSTAAGTPVASVPLVVMQPVELAGIISRTWDALRLWIK